MLKSSSASNRLHPPVVDELEHCRSTAPGAPPGIGYYGGDPRLPLLPLTAAQRHKVESSWRELKINSFKASRVHAARFFLGVSPPPLGNDYCPAWPRHWACWWRPRCRRLRRVSSPVHRSAAYAPDRLLEQLLRSFSNPNCSSRWLATGSLDKSSSSSVSGFSAAFWKVDILNLEIGPPAGSVRGSMINSSSLGFVRVGVLLHP